MKLKIWSAFLVASLVLAACGDGDDGVDEPEETVEEEGEDEAVEEEGEDEAVEDEGAEEEAAGDDRADWPDSIVFTLTPSQEQGGLIETAEPLAELLAAELGVEVEALVPTDYAGVIVALESGQADVAGGLGPRQMVQAEEQAGAELILQSERFGDFSYVTQWMTNDPDTFCGDEPVDVDGYLYCNGVSEAGGPGDGPIGDEYLAEIAGQTVSFVDQGSTSGYAVPALQLLNAGVDPIDGIDSFFAGGHDNSVLSVYNGDAVVGTSYNDARGDVAEQAEDVGQEVVVFAWSAAIPNDGFAVRGDLPDSLQEAITDAFLAIADSEDGIALLNELYNIDGLNPVNSGEFDTIRQLEQELGERLDG
ncbi:MAG: phosphate/phosphite/phosphonate ABC transporter substrate-binding protein [Actinomycetota bacterium]